MVSEKRLKECLDRVDLDDPRTVHEALYAIRQEISELERLQCEVWQSNRTADDKKSLLRLLTVARSLLAGMIMALEGENTRRT